MKRDNWERERLDKIKTKALADKLKAQKLKEYNDNVVASEQRNRKVVAELDK